MRLINAVTDPAISLAMRKQALMMHSARLRAAIEQDVAALSPAFSAADSLMQAARWVGAHRVQAFGALALAGLIRPRAVVRWARRGLLAWGLCRRAGAALQSAFAVWRYQRG